MSRISWTAGRAITGIMTAGVGILVGWRIPIAECQSVAKVVGALPIVVGKVRTVTACGHYRPACLT